jgi:hypothetical protein
LVFAVNAVMGGIFDFHFWRASLALVGIHRWNEPAAMSSATTIRLLLTITACAMVFLLRAFLPGDRSASLTSRPGFLISALLFGLAAMQTVMVRSDDQHFVLAVYPTVFLAGATLFSFSSPRIIAVAAVLAVGLSAVFGQPIAIFQLSSFQYRFSQLVQPVTECPDRFRQLQGVCYPARFATMLDTGTNFLTQHSRENDSVVLFPYQCMFGMASRRNVAGGVLQSFIAGGPYLSRVDLAGYERSGAPAGLYFPDGPLSMALDGVPNFTRNPDTWFWILRHYRSDQEIWAGIFGLQKDDSRAARISLLSLPLTITGTSYTIDEPDSILDLGDLGWPTQGADFLRLRLTVPYDPQWHLRKPERLRLKITRADGSHDVQSFVVEPNRSSDIWFHPWKPADLAYYFGGDESLWRRASRPAITGAQLLVEPFDWVSVKPDSLEVEAADAVRVSLRPEGPSH